MIFSHVVVHRPPSLLSPSRAGGDKGVIEDTSSSFAQALKDAPLVSSVSTPAANASSTSGKKRTRIEPIPVAKSGASTASAARVVDPKSSAGASGASGAAASAASAVGGAVPAFRLSSVPPQTRVVRELNLPSSWMGEEDPFIVEAEVSENSVTGFVSQVHCVQGADARWNVRVEERITHIAGTCKNVFSLLFLKVDLNICFC